MINIMWNLVAETVIKLKGYLPAKSLKMGSDNESARSHYETNAWLKSEAWLDWHDKFDYLKALQKLLLPPVLYLAGIKDEVLGNPTDVKLLAWETGQQNSKVVILSKKNGNKHDYGHIDILIHKDAETDHFPMVIKWMQQHAPDYSKKEE